MKIKKEKDVCKADIMTHTTYLTRVGKLKLVHVCVKDTATAETCWQTVSDK